jgi:hypothetical protein
MVLDHGECHVDPGGDAGRGPDRAIAHEDAVAPAPSFESGRPETAPPAVLKALTERLAPDLTLNKERAARVAERVRERFA